MGLLGHKLASLTGVGWDESEYQTEESRAEIRSPTLPGQGLETLFLDALI